MYNDTIHQSIQRVTEAGETAAIALVVRREAPSSGKPGDTALITPDGQLHGWIGGGCTQGIVIKEALEAIDTLRPRLVRIQPGTDVAEQEGVKNYKMTCMSGGSVEVFIEPVMPTTRIRIFGRSHIARALCAVGKAAGFRMEVISDLAEADMFPQADALLPLNGFQGVSTPNDFVVVCTQGEDDAGSLLAALKLNPGYLGFVASRKKAQGIFTDLRLLHKVNFEQLKDIKTPAGIDINAKTPDEVAISILAEIIQLKRNAVDAAEAGTPEMSDEYYMNPVCNIPVQKATARHILEHNGEKVYFCCDGCKESFEEAPEKYIAAEA